jgi:hypothetical protein
LYCSQAVAIWRTCTCANASLESCVGGGTPGEAQPAAANKQQATSLI